MDELGVTLYFNRFGPDSTEDEFRDLFSRFGNIEKVFLCKSKNYGMVVFDNNRSCIEAIEQLHLKPPLKLFVQMAKNQIHSNGSVSGNSGRRSQNYNNYNQSYNKASYEVFEDNIVYDECAFYVDENNEHVTVFQDDQTGETYVPIRYAPGIRKIIRRVPRKITSGNFDDRYSVKSDGSERSVRVGPKRNDFKPKNGSDQKYGNLFENKKHEQSDSHARNHVQQNEENRSPNASNRIGSKFSKSSSRPQKPFGENRERSAKIDNEDWSSESSVPKSSDLKETLVNVGSVKTSRVAAAKPKTVPVEPAKPKTVAVEPAKPATSTPVTSSTKVDDKVPLKTIELPNNLFTEVHVESAINEETGWVTITNKSIELEEMTMDIYKVVDDVQSCAPELGKLVLALFEDIWFRAVVLSASPSIRVRYIDYGNEEVVQKAAIKEMPAEFSKIPAFALRIKLADGAPCKMTNDIKIKVKPIKKENNVTVVHVENGVYPMEPEAPIKKPPIEKPKVAKISDKHATENGDEHVLNITHKLLLSQIDVGHKGLLECTTRLNTDTKFIASFMPLHLTEALAKLQDIQPPANPSFKGVVGEVVCVEHEGGWQRAYLMAIEDKRYKVAVIDYGVINHVAEIRSLPIEFIDIPIFSCVCTAPNGHNLTQPNENSIDFEISQVLGQNISCAIKIDGISANIVCSPWDPRLPEHVPQPTTNQSNTNNKNKSQQLEQITLKNGENVKLEMENEGYLLVRNKYASDVRKKIDKFMAEHGAQAPTISDKPQVGQLVTADFEGEFYRAIVTSIKNNDVCIFYIDYGNEETRPFFSLKRLNAEMSKEPMTIIKIRLRNFIDKPFTVKQLQYLENLAVKRITLKATYDEHHPENGFELKAADGLNVTEALEKLETTPPIPLPKPKEKPQPIQKEPVQKEKEFYEKIKIPNDNDPKVLITELALVDIPLGKREVIFQEFSDIENNLLCVCVNDPQVLHRVQVEMQTQMAKYVKNMLPTGTSYKPEMEECVLVHSEGKWFRGACTMEPENDEFNIFLVDYGSCNEFSAKDLRRMPKEFAQEKALCNFAKMAGLPDNMSPSLVSRLPTLLERNNSYPVNVLQKIEEDEYYIIEFPTIIQALKEENLI